jgi:hypothetical protein
MGWDEDRLRIALEEAEERIAELTRERDEALAANLSLAQSLSILGGAWADEDQPLREDDTIKAAHPSRADANHETYGEAMRLVGAKRSKGALVALVNWLLVRLETMTKDRDEALGIVARYRKAYAKFGPP